MKRFRLFSIVWLLLFAPLLMQAVEVADIHNKVTHFFSKGLDVERSALVVTLKHLPDDLHTIDAAEIYVYSQKRNLDAGYQTVWVKLIRGGELLKKFPVSVNVNVEKQVYVAARNIGYGDVIREDMLVLEKRRLGDDFRAHFSEMRQLANCESKLTIKPGTVLTRRMIRSVPAVHRGRQVNVEIRAGRLSVSTHGKAKSDGYVGEDVRVVLSETGKIIRGEIVSVNNVVVIQE